MVSAAMSAGLGANGSGWCGGVAAKAAGAVLGMIGAEVAHSGIMASRWKLSPRRALTTVMFSNMIVALMFWRNGNDKIEFVAIDGPSANVTRTGRPWTTYGVLYVIIASMMVAGPLRSTPPILNGCIPSMSFRWANWWTTLGWIREIDL